MRNTSTTSEKRWLHDAENQNEHTKWFQNLRFQLTWEMPLIISLPKLHLKQRLHPHYIIRHNQASWMLELVTPPCSLVVSASWYMRHTRPSDHPPNLPFTRLCPLSKCLWYAISQSRVNTTPQGTVVLSSPTQFHLPMLESRYPGPILGISWCSLNVLRYVFNSSTRCLWVFGPSFSRRLSS